MMGISRQSTIMKKILIILSGLLGVIFLTWPASAIEPSNDPIDRNAAACMDRAPSTAGMIECLQQAYTAWDAELNAVYADVRLRLNPQAQSALKNAQRLWLSYRDAEFAAIDAIYGAMQGSMWQLAGLSRKVEFLKNRVIELRMYQEDLSQAN